MYPWTYFPRRLNSTSLENRLPTSSGKSQATIMTGTRLILSCIYHNTNMLHAYVYRLTLIASKGNQSFALNSLVTSIYGILLCINEHVFAGRMRDSLKKKRNPCPATSVSEGSGCYSSIPKAPKLPASSPSLASSLSFSPSSSSASRPCPSLNTTKFSTPPPMAPRLRKTRSPISLIPSS